jgi:hypothetical protein
LVDVENLSGTIDPFAQAAAGIAGSGFDQSAAAGATYYGLFRRIELASAVAAGVTVAVTPALVLMAGQLRGAALKGILDGRRAGMTMSGAKDQGLIKVSGELTKLVLGGGRQTIIDGTATDGRALGWLRATSGDPCAFCRSLAARGPAYKSEQTAEFHPHDHCSCMPEPVYRGDPAAVGVAAQSDKFHAEFRDAQAWAKASGTMSVDTSNNALNNYRRWLDNGRPAAGQYTSGDSGNG